MRSIRQNTTTQADKLIQHYKSTHDKDKNHPIHLQTQNTFWHFDTQLKWRKLTSTDTINMRRENYKKSYKLLQIESIVNVDGKCLTRWTCNEYEL